MQCWGEGALCSPPPSDVTSRLHLGVITDAFSSTGIQGPGTFVCLSKQSTVIIFIAPSSLRDRKLVTCHQFYSLDITRKFGRTGLIISCVWENGGPVCGGDLSKGTWQGHHRSRAGSSSPTAALTVEVAVLFSKVVHSTYTEGPGSHPTPCP